MSRNTVQKYVRELEYKALIITEPTKYESKSGRVRNGNLIYTILPKIGVRVGSQMRIWCKVWGCKWAKMAESRGIFRCHKLV